MRAIISPSRLGLIKMVTRERAILKPQQTDHSAVLNGKENRLSRVQIFFRFWRIGSLCGVGTIEKMDAICANAFECIQAQAVGEGIFPSIFRTRNLAIYSKFSNLDSVVYALQNVDRRFSGKTKSYVYDNRLLQRKFARQD